MLSRIKSLLPRRSDYAALRYSWRGDLIAGFSVGIIALPLALALGVTTGMGAAAGLVTAIVAGLVAAVFGGSNVQVSGVSAAMAVVLVPIVASSGPNGVLVVGLMAGVLLTIAALARLGRYLAYVPWPVVEGFSVGIAFIIFLQQVPAALGVPNSGHLNPAVAAWDALLLAVADPHPMAVTLVVIVVATMVLLPRIQPALPSSLIGVAAATILAVVAKTDVPTIGDLPDSLPLPSLPSIELGMLSELFPAAFAVAVLAALESLLSAKVADGMSDESSQEPDRELFGQGLANIASPLFGGMPATGAIARTAVNVRAGARTRAAAIVHSLLLLVVVYLGGPLVAQIPLAALAGVLMVTAARMVDLDNVRAVVRSTRSDAVVLALTAAATLVFDLIVAVQLGIAVAAILSLRTIARSAGAVRESIPMSRNGSTPALRDGREAHDTGEGTEDETIDAEEEARLLRDRIVVYRLDGVLFFGAAQKFLTDLTEVADVEVVILRLPRLRIIDATGAQALGEIVQDLESRGITVLLKGATEHQLRILSRVGALDDVIRDEQIFDDLDVAIDRARELVAQARLGRHEARARG